MEPVFFRRMSRFLVPIHCQQCNQVIELRPGESTIPEVCPLCGSTIGASQSVAFIPTRARVIDQFELIERIGRGHFGEVWKARDTKLDRYVALKLPRANLEDEMLSLFVREARAAAGLKHANIVPVHDVGTGDDSTYIVSDLISGITLAKSLNDEKPSHRDALAMCEKLALALHYAHQEGVVHRDIKPGNIMIDGDGEPHIMDFGLAKQATSESTIAEDGRLMGTACYMPPEQARGTAYKADARSDVYSLGIILYRMLTAELPFTGETSVVIHKVLTKEPRPPRVLDRTIPRDAETVCLKAIQKEPSQRYQDAEEFAADLRRILEDRPIVARRAGVVERGVRWVRRNRALAGATLVALLAFSAFVYVLASGSRRADRDDNSPGPPPQEADPTTTVEIATDPPGARLVFVPVNATTGIPDAGGAVRPKGDAGAPVTVSLRPGLYWVEAEIPGFGFQEVYRTVPGAKDVDVNSHNHLSHHRFESGTVALPAIKIHRTKKVTQSMTLVTGGSLVFGRPKRRHRIADFHISCRESSIADYVQRGMSLPLALREYADASLPVTHVKWDQAVAFAEAGGARLLTFPEMVYAATNKGTTPVPWRGYAPPARWEIGPVDAATHDRTLDARPIRMLASNVAEWTNSWWIPNTSFPDRLLPQVKAVLPHSRVVYGAPQSVMNARPDSREWATIDALRRLLHSQQSCHRDAQKPGIGIRLGRSRQPRYLNRRKRY